MTLNITKTELERIIKNLDPKKIITFSSVRKENDDNDSIELIPFIKFVKAEEEDIYYKAVPDNENVDTVDAEFVLGSILDEYVAGNNTIISITGIGSIDISKSTIEMAI